MAKIEAWLSCDLKKPVQVQGLSGNVFSMDNNGSRINVRIYDNGEKTTVSGSVTANCILADGSTINVNGSLTTANGQSVAYVDIPQSCLLVPGPIRITIKLTASGVITTLAAVVTTVYRTQTDIVITPSAQIINDWNAEISAAIATQNAAIANQDTKINDLKSAFEYADKDVITNKKLISGVNVVANGSHSWLCDSTGTWKSGSYLKFDITGLEAGDKLTVGCDYMDAFGSQAVGIYWRQADDTDISNRTFSKTDVIGKEVTVTAPANTKKARVNFMINSNSSGNPPTLNEIYHIINAYVLKNSSRILDSDMVKNAIPNNSLGNSMMQVKMKHYAFYYRNNSTEVINFDSSTETITIPVGFVIQSLEDSTEIVRTSTAVSFQRDSASNINYIVYSTSGSEFVRRNVYGAVQTTDILVCAITAKTISMIGVPYKIDGKLYGINVDESSTLPSAWKNMIQTIQESQGTKFCFGIQTDTHFYINQETDFGNYLKLMTNYIGFDFIANLGDLIQGYASETQDTNANTREVMTTAMHNYTTGVSCPFMIAFGNHDDNHMHADAYSHDPLSMAEVYGRMFAPAFNTDNRFAKTVGKMYYYLDFDRVRVIVLNTNANGGDTFGVDSDQISWFTNKALDTNKAIIVMSHVPLVNGWSVSSNYHESFAYIVSALQSFKQNGGTVICCLAGHTHEQEDQTVDNILYMTFRNAGSRAEFVLVDMENKAINTFGIGTNVNNRSLSYS